MSSITPASEWRPTAADPNDEQFAHVVDAVPVAEADAYDAALLGEPFDGAVIGRPGASSGPGGLRDALAATKTHHFDAGPVESVADVGDVQPPAGNVTFVQSAVREISGRLHDADTFPVFLGGDNSLSYPNAAPLLERGSLGCISLDAHLDCREVRADATSGTPYRQLYQEGLDAFAVVGARHFETTRTYAEYVTRKEGEIVTAEEVGEDVVRAADLALEAMADVDQVYLSLDLDVLEAAAAPGVSAPTPGGLSTRECFRLLRLLAADERVAGFEVVECAPPLDTDGRTSAAGARAIAHVLSVTAGRDATGRTG